MSGNTDFDNKEIAGKIAKKILSFIVRNKRKAMIVGIVFFLYMFAVVIFQTAPKPPKTVSADRRLSYLNLMEYIDGYRDFQQDFDVEHLKFGDKFLNFTLNIKFKAKSILIIKKLALDIVQGLSTEYPELESIRIKVLRDRPGDGSITIYGLAEYSKEDGSIVWRYQ